MLPGLKASYGKSGHGVADSYSAWRRHSVHAYTSATHGGRYVQNYANGNARAYALYEASGRFPAGSQLAKDSFAVKKNGKLAPGPLFLMEKMPAGFSPATGDWRYTMILPNGTVFGTTKGANAAKVQFCADCHLSVAPDQDSVMLLPEEYRVTQ